MTNANMKLVMVDVPFPEKLEMPTQKLDPGEFITARIVELSKLTAVFKGSTHIAMHLSGSPSNQLDVYRIRGEGQQSYPCTPRTLADYDCPGLRDRC